MLMEKNWNTDIERKTHFASQFYRNYIVWCMKRIFLSELIFYFLTLSLSQFHFLWISLSTEKRGSTLKATCVYLFILCSSTTQKNSTCLRTTRVANTEKLFHHILIISDFCTFASIKKFYAISVHPMHFDVMPISFVFFPSCDKIACQSTACSWNANTNKKPTTINKRFSKLIIKCTKFSWKCKTLCSSFHFNKWHRHLIIFQVHNCEQRTGGLMMRIETKVWQSFCVAVKIHLIFANRRRQFNCATFVVVCLLRM